ncbi:MAG: hypothetical protein J6C04_07970, partial [Oscillospiraceae bacterium]|nr:hypothetical protein [Oscillospiraceae bacterium]
GNLNIHGNKLKTKHRARFIRALFVLQKLLKQMGIALAGEISYTFNIINIGDIYELQIGQIWE